MSGKSSVICFEKEYSGFDLSRVISVYDENDWVYSDSEIQSTFEIYDIGFNATIISKWGISDQEENDIIKDIVNLCKISDSSGISVDNLIVLLKKHTDESMEDLFK